MELHDLSASHMHELLQMEKSELTILPLLLLCNYFTSSSSVTF